MAELSLRRAAILCLLKAALIDIVDVKEGYKPLEVSSGAGIIPDGQQPSDPTAPSLSLHPGLAFGTGKASHFAQLPPCPSASIDGRS